MNAIVVSDLSPFPGTEKSMRPASEERRCFYCHMPIGAFHKKDCEHITARVRVRMVVEFERKALGVGLMNEESIRKEMFYLNESSSCMDNRLEELEAYAKEQGCLCSTNATFEVLGFVGEATCEEEP